MLLQLLLLLGKRAFELVIIEQYEVFRLFAILQDKMLGPIVTLIDKYVNLVLLCTIRC